MPDEAEKTPELEDIKDEQLTKNSTAQDESSTTVDEDKNILPVKSDFATRDRDFAKAEFSLPAKDRNEKITLIFGSLLAVAFLGLISLAFWQWENLQRSNRQIENLTKTLEQVAEDISFVNKDSDDKAMSLKAALNKLNANVKNLTTDMTSQKKLSGSNSKNISALNKSFEDARSSLTRSVENLNANLAKNINALDVQLRKLEQSDRNLTAQIKGVNNNLGELSIVVDALNTKLKQISIKDIKEMREAKNSLEEDIRSLKIATNRLSRQVEALLKAKN